MVLDPVFFPLLPCRYLLIGLLMLIAACPRCLTPSGSSNHVNGAKAARLATGHKHGFKQGVGHFDFFFLLQLNLYSDFDLHVDHLTLLPHALPRTSSICNIDHHHFSQLQMQHSRQPLAHHHVLLGHSPHLKLLLDQQAVPQDYE